VREKRGGGKKEERKIIENLLKKILPLLLLSFSLPLSLLSLAH
jgi:hypothetical protein